jgi:hypothetical protein
MTPTELRHIAFRRQAAPVTSTKPLADASQSVVNRNRIGNWRRRSFRSFVLTVSAFGAAALLIANRNAIAAQWSPSAIIFASLGAPVNQRGLEITNLRSVLIEEDGQRILTVEGDIKNVGSARLKVPELDMHVRGSMARTLYTWKSPSPRSDLSKGEIMTFRTRLAAPPDGAIAVQVRFSSI